MFGAGLREQLAIAADNRYRTTGNITRAVVGDLLYQADTEDRLHYPQASARGRIVDAYRNVD